MKRALFLTVMSLFAFTFMQAENPNHTGDVINFGVDYYDQPIEFVERGIKFYVFLNGDFDFNTAPTAQVDYVSRRGNHSYHTPHGVRIERDGQGRIRRVGNVFISYSRYNKVKRIGSVFIDYRRNKMIKVGNLRIIYDHYGVRFIGSVMGHTFYSPYFSSGWSSFNTPGGWMTWEYGYYDPFFHSHDFTVNYVNYHEDDNYYYYRSKNDKAKKGQVIKRKKAANSNRGESRRQL
jgi:hypothetical protein